MPSGDNFGMDRCACLVAEKKRAARTVAEIGDAQHGLHDCRLADSSRTDKTDIFSSTRAIYPQFHLVDNFLARTRMAPGRGSRSTVEPGASYSVFGGLLHDC